MACIIYRYLQVIAISYFYIISYHSHLQVIDQLVPRLFGPGGGSADRCGPPVVAKVVLHLGLPAADRVLENILSDSEGRNHHHVCG